MRRALFAFLVWTLACAAECRAQSLDTFSGMPIGKDIFPMMYIDESVVGLATFESQAFPQEPFEEALACLEAAGAPIVLHRPRPPQLWIVPTAHTLRVVDMTLDSLVALRDTTALLGRFQNPVQAYTLVRSGVVLATTRAASNRGILRHEAIHWLLWYAVPVEKRADLYWHPPQYFRRCDWEYQG